MKLIIDTDVGIDDALALLMVVAHPQAQIEAITTVVGNVPLAQATHNAGLVLDIAHAPSIPIYKGCAKPLLQYSPQNATTIHGADGLGGAGRAETSRPIESEHAGLALVRLARQNSGQVTLLTIGPLTNVALAIRLDPNFIKNLKRLVIMGGAVDGRGNTSPLAEFNFAVDPEAAKIVFDACSRAGLSIELISWEATLANSVAADTWEKLIAGDSPIAHFVQVMTAHIKQTINPTGSAGFLWPDPLAAAVALAPEIVVTQERRFIEVLTGHNLARGQTIVDYRPESSQTSNAQIIRKVNAQKFQKLLHLAVHGQGG